MLQLSNSELIVSIFVMTMVNCFSPGIQRADENLPHHLDVKNLHSFGSKDLEKLILKVCDSHNNKIR